MSARRLLDTMHHSRGDVALLRRGTEWMETFEYLSLFLSLLTFLPLVLSVFRSLVDFTLLPAFHFAAYSLKIPARATDVISERFRALCHSSLARRRFSFYICFVFMYCTAAKQQCATYHPTSTAVTASLEIQNVLKTSFLSVAAVLSGADLCWVVLHSSSDQWM